MLHPYKLIQTKRKRIETDRRRWVRELVRCTVTGIALSVPSASFAAAPAVVLTQVPVRQTAAATAPWSARAELSRFEGARIIRLTPDGRQRVLSAGFVSACDPEVSFDGQRLLFAGRKEARSAWAVWEMPLDGGPDRARRITKCEGDCRHPIYLSSLFTLNSPEPWYTLAFVGLDGTLNEVGERLSTSLYSVRLDGAELRRISFNPNADVDPFQMLDSRLIYSGWHYPRRTAGAAPRMSLFGMNIDGTELELYGAEQGKRFQRMGCATPEGLVVFVESDAPSPDGAGQLGCVRERRPHHSYHPLTRDRHFAYLDPAPFTNGTLLVSRRPGNGPGPAGLYCFHPDTGNAELLFNSPGYHDRQAKMLQPRPEPDGRSTIVNLKFDTGILYALNCYDLDPRLRPHLAHGEFKKLRVIEGLPAPAPETAFAHPPGARAVSGEASRVLRRRLLGTVPINADGSFNVQIPADIPVELQALDEEEMALATCGWIWVKQKENRGCIGCHEDPELLPENAFVQGVQHPSHQLTLPPARRRGVGFREDILPILRNKCATADCHGSADNPLQLATAQEEGQSEAARQIYDQLLDGQAHSPAYVVPGQARNSFVIWQLLGRRAARPWDAASNCRTKVRKMPPPDKGSELTATERQTFIEWIDLGAQWRVTEARPAETPIPGTP